MFVTVILYGMKICGHCGVFERVCVNAFLLFLKMWKAFQLATEM